MSSVFKSEFDLSDKKRKSSFHPYHNETVFLRTPLVESERIIETIAGCTTDSDLKGYAIDIRYNI